MSWEGDWPFWAYSVFVGLWFVFYVCAGLGISKRKQRQAARQWESIARIMSDERLKVMVARPIVPGGMVHWVRPHWLSYCLGTYYYDPGLYSAAIDEKLRRLEREQVILKKELAAVKPFVQ